jgi:hypothetical protein
MRWQLLQDRAIPVEERGSREELMGLLMGVAAQGLHEAGGYRVRIKVGASPVEEVAVAEGGPGLLEEAREVGPLPHGSGPLLR